MSMNSELLNYTLRITYNYIIIKINCIIMMKNFKYLQPLIVKNHLIPCVFYKTNKLL